MSELMCIPKRQPVYITIPQPLCEVPDCSGIRLVDMVALFLDQDRLEIFQVCGFHKWVWEGRTPTKFYPLNNSPSIQWMADQIRQELQRRAAQRPVIYQNVFYGNVTYGGTGTGTTYYRFE